MCPEAPATAVHTAGEHGTQQGWAPELLCPRHLRCLNCRSKKSHLSLWEKIDFDWDTLMEALGSVFAQAEGGMLKA